MLLLLLCSLLESQYLFNCFVNLLSSHRDTEVSYEYEKKFIKLFFLSPVRRLTVWRTEEMGQYIVLYTILLNLSIRQGGLVNSLEPWDTSQLKEVKTGFLTSIVLKRKHWRQTEERWHYHVSPRNTPFHWNENNDVTHEDLRFVCHLQCNMNVTLMYLSTMFYSHVLVNTCSH